MNNKIPILILIAVCGLISACKSGGSNLTEVFSDMEKAIKNGDENLFKKQWHGEGYDKNLVGKSGLEGIRVFQQGSRKKWFPKPDFSKKISEGRVEIVPTEIWSWEKEKSVDEVFFAIVQTDSGLKILGGGEDLSQVIELAKRHNKGAPLPAPK